MSVDRLDLILDILRIIMLLGILVTVLILLVHAGKSYGQSYLYDGVEFAPIVDYLATPRRSDETEADYMLRLDNPEFLSNNDSSHRIVVFYAPWCGHCQTYVQTYVQAAREIQKTHHFSFYAVSCTVHDPICSQHQVRGYPTLKYFPPGSAKGNLIDHRESAQAILRDIGLDTPNNVGSKVGKTEDGSNILKDAKEIKSLKIIPENIEMSVNRDPESFAQKRKLFVASRVSRVIEDKNMLFNDAAMSFRFALRYSIFSGASEQMSQQSSSALRNWLELLVKALPADLMGPTITLSHHLLNDFDKVIARDQAFTSSFYVTEDSFTWSSSCAPNNSISGTGYTCGLWYLFHIMTIGLVEWNKSAPIEERISTIHAAITLRNYIQHFFMCEECRRNFLDMFDSCRFDHCHLLTGSTTVGWDWEQLSLWLFEAHNDVRVRTFKEGLLREGMSEASLVEIQLVLWPPRDKCPACWRDNELVPLSATNKLEIFNFMHRTFWAGQMNSLQPRYLSNYRSTLATALFLLTIAVSVYRTNRKLSHLKSG